MGTSSHLTVTFTYMSLILSVLVDLDANNQFDWSGIHVSDFGIQSFSRVDTVPEGFVVGTLSYVSPERLYNASFPISAECDMWAVGCIGYEMCIGQQLSANNNRLPIDNVIRGGELDLTLVSEERYGESIRQIIRRCLQYDPAQRCTAVHVRDYICSLLSSSQ
jgi:serine/threonine protein kinase